MGGKAPAELVQFLRDLNRGQDLAEVARTILRYAIAAVPGAQSGSLLVLDEQGETFRYVAAEGWDMNLLAPVCLPRERMIQRGLPLDQPAIVRRPLDLNRKLLGKELAATLAAAGRLAAFITLPVVDSGEVVGYLNLDNLEDPNAFSEDDFSRLDLVWEEITLAVRAARARRKLAESEQLFRLLFDRLADAVYITAHNGTILDANPAAEGQTGYSREELLRLNIMHNVAAHEPTITYEEVNKRLVRGEVVVFEEEKKRKDGTLFWTEVAVALFSYRGQVATVSVNRDITSRVEAREAAARRDAVLSAVAFAAERFLRAPSLDEAVPDVLARLGEAADVSRLYVFEDHRDEQGRLLASQRYEWAAPGVEPQLDNPQLQGFSYAEAGFSRWVEAFARGEPVAGLVREFPEQERTFLAAEQIQAIVAVPVFASGERWGFVGFDECRRERGWSAGEIEALRAAAGALGAAIERTRIEEDLRDRNADLQGLYSVSAALGTSLDLSEVYERVYQEVSHLVPCDAFTLALVDAQRGEFRLAFAVEEGTRLPELVVPLDPETSLTAWIATTKKPLLVRDFDAEKDDLPAVAQQVGKAVRSWLGVPLLFQDEVLGVLSVQSFAPRAYDENDLLLLRTISAPVATSIRNARAYTGLAVIEHKLRAVEDVSRRMKLAQTRDELYEIVLALTDSVLGYRPCAILEPREGELVLVAGHEEIAWACGLRVRVDGPGITAQAARSREPVYVADVSVDERYLRGNSDTRCELALPISVGERLLGVLDVQTDRVDGVPPEDRDLLGIVASELAVALAGLEQLARLEGLSAKLARLHEASRHLARCTNEEDICRAAVRAMVEVLGFEHANIGVGRGDLLVPTACMGSISVKARPFKRGEGIAGKTWLTGESAWGNLDDFVEARPVDPRIQAFISVPIGSAGVIQVLSTQRDAFTSEDVTLVEIVARHVFEELRRVQLEQELREQAIRDPLTGLYNRRFLGETLAREVERAKRYSHPVTLIMADIDDFKAVNDRYGHATGDAALRCVADVLRTNLRAGDFVFRYGGEEFVVVLPETKNGEGDALQRLQEKTSAIVLADVPGLTVSVSLGHAVWDPSCDGPTTPEDLLRQADEVLYAIKRRRGGR